MRIGDIPASGTAANLGLQPYNSSTATYLSDASYADKALCLAFVDMDRGWAWLDSLKAIRQSAAFPGSAEIIAVIFRYGGSVTKMNVITKLAGASYPFSLLVDNAWGSSSAAYKYTECFQHSMDDSYDGADASCAGDVFWACLLQRDHRISDKWRYDSLSLTAPSKGDPLAMSRLPRQSALLSLGGARGSGELTIDLAGIAAGARPLGGDSRLTLYGSRNAYVPDFDKPRVTSALPADGTSPDSPSPLALGFSEPVSGAGLAGSYALGGAGVGTLSVGAADYREALAFDSKLPSSVEFYVLQRLIGLTDKPAVLYADPEKDSRLKALPQVKLYFSRPMDKATLHGMTDSFTPGAAGVTVDAVSYEGRGLIENVATISLGGTIPVGSFSLSLSGVADISGDPLEGQASIPYEIYPATVLDVTSPAGDAAYTSPALVELSVEFSEPVSVTGAPSLALNAGATAVATLKAGQTFPRTIVAFEYAVQSGHESAGLDYADASSLALNGGAIEDAWGNDADLELPVPGEPHSLGANKAIVVDTSAPSVPAPTTATPTSDATPEWTWPPCTDAVTSVTAYRARLVGEAAWHDRGLTRSFIPDALTVGGHTVEVQARDEAGNWSASGTHEVVIVSATPAVTDVSSSAADNSYDAGTVLPISVTFSAVVTVSGGPRLALNAGASAYAVYQGGSGTATLTFRYTVAAGENSGHLDYRASDSLELNGGSITGASGAAAALTLPAPGTAGSLGANKHIIIDTVRPKVVGVCLGTRRIALGTRTIRIAKLTFTEQVVVPRQIFPPLKKPTVLSPRGLAGVTLTYLEGSGSSTLVFRLDVPDGAHVPPHLPPQLPHLGGAVALEAVSGWVRDKAGNDAILKFDASIISECPASPPWKPPFFRREP